MRIGMGLDGGGTKTDSVLMDDSGRVLGRGRGSASNPSRIGVDAAAQGVMEAANAALRGANLPVERITDVCAGLAGVALQERAHAMKKLLSEFFVGTRFELCTDLDLALSAAGPRPAIVLVAGTGSAAIGRDPAGRIARSGGYGPKKSDQGSAFAIGKNGVLEVVNATSDAAANLRMRIQKCLGIESIEQIVGLDGAEADAVYPRVFRVISLAADEANEVAQKVLRDAAENLTEIVAAVQEDLKLIGTPYLLGKTGGMIGRSEYFDDILDTRLRQVAPQAELETLQTPLAEVAARRALSL